MEGFLKDQPDLLQQLKQSSTDVSKASKEGTRDEVVTAHRQFLEAINTQEVTKKMSEFDTAHKNNPIFVVMRHYMRMVMEMLAFIRAVRTGNWKLHLITLELFTKYFFAHDKINYARMMPLYLAEMNSLEESDPAIHEEFTRGNWVVNKNGEVAFCAVGADNGLEHLNRSMKVSGGLVGISQNVNARTKFFLIAPELATLATQAKAMAGVFPDTPEHHHNLSPSKLAREDKAVLQLTETIKSFTNPFSASDDEEPNTELYNLVTKVVMLEKCKNDMCQQSAIGMKLYQTFTDERIKAGKVSLWASMKKRKLETCKCMGKVIKVKSTQKVIEMKEDRSLFARLMMVCKSRPDVDIKEAVGLYEFNVVPKSLFASDGTMLHCSCKSSLMHILEQLNDETRSFVENVDQDTEVQVKRVAIIDGMAEVQALDKPAWVKNCKQLADHFSERLFDKYNGNDEIRVIFDRYDIPLSLKSATRKRRQGGEVPIYYRVTNTTHIANVSMKKLLRHTKTKAELATLFAKEVMERGKTESRNVVVAWGTACEATHKEMSQLQSDHEEADTKMILHAIDASADGATELTIHSPDTDVLVLAIRRYTDLCSNSSFVTGKGTNHRRIKLGPIAHALGPAKVAALPAFHALTGADNTGCFAGKGKLKCWKAFEDCDSSILNALGNLGNEAQPDAVIKDAIGRFVCQLYVPKTDITTVKQLRWSVFKKKQAESERLPPTQAALDQAILRAHFQMMVWNKDNVPNPVLPSPNNYGWVMENDEWVPVMTTLEPAPKAIIQLVKCACAKSRCSSNRCQCRKAGLFCTDMCECSEDSDCENQQSNDEDATYDDDVEPLSES